MKAVYSEYLTIDTKPDTILDVSSPVWALQEVVRGKALVFGNGIVPLAPHLPLCKGIALRLSDTPENMPDTELQITPTLSKDGKPALCIDCHSYAEYSPSVTTLTAAAREYINNMTEDELIEHGHNEFSGKDQMIAALHTIDQLAAHDEEEARAAYFVFLGNNLSGMSFEIKD